jgi:hypothetical protein
MFNKEKWLSLYNTITHKTYNIKQVTFLIYNYDNNSYEGLKGTEYLCSFQIGKNLKGLVEIKMYKT